MQTGCRASGVRGAGRSINLGGGTHAFEAKESADGRILPDADTTWTVLDL